MAYLTHVNPNTMIKYFFTVLLFIAGLCPNVHGQTFESLQKAKSSKELNDSTSIIYGLFIQRLGFTSGGFPQEIRLQNILTQKMYTFNVKATMKSGKENSFCYYVKPGMYKVLSYYWTKSKWYGGEVHEEPIFKGVDTTTKAYNNAVKKGTLDTCQLQSYHIEIRPKGIYYLGTWHFDAGLVSFSDDKASLDDKLKNKFSNIDFENAITKLPE